jgi:hypothetical protein
LSKQRLRQCEPLTYQFDVFGQRTCAEAEGVPDQARLAKNVAREVEDRRLTLAEHTITSKLLIVALAVFID